MRKPGNNSGYTLAELIIAMAAIAVLSSIAIPSYGRYIEAAREKVCMRNRQTVLYEYQLYIIGEPEIGLSDYISTSYAEGIDWLCPGEGTLITDGFGEAATLCCSVHSDEVIK